MARSRSAPGSNPASSADWTGIAALSRALGFASVCTNPTAAAPPTLAMNVLRFIPICGLLDQSESPVTRDDDVSVAHFEAVSSGPLQVGEVGPVSSFDTRYPALRPCVVSPDFPDGFVKADKDADV